MVKNTPAMGWNTWNTFTNTLNEKLIIESIDALVDSGLTKYGYEYIVIDDFWQEPVRDKNGRFVPNKEKFPHGIKYIADYAHKKGVKIGIYSCAGPLTCGGLPGSYNHEFIDAKTFAEWNIDYLKYDYCYHSNLLPGDILYKRMGLALSNCGREIYFSACSWGAENTRRWIKETNANSFRSTYDILDSWGSIKALATSQINYMEYNGQGCFNDLDMLVAGMNGKGNCSLGGCSYEEYYTHFAFWCLFGSILMLGCDIRNIDEKSLKIITNEALIRIDQDKKANQPFVVGVRREKNTNISNENDSFYNYNPTGIVKMAKILDDGSIALGIFNFGDDDTSKDRTWVQPEELGIPQELLSSLDITDCEDGSKLKVENNIIIPKNMKAHQSRVYIIKIKNE